MAQDAESFSWSNYSQEEWSTCTKRFEGTIFKMVSNDRAMKGLLMSLDRTFHPNLSSRSELYDKVYDHSIKLHSRESVDSDLKANLELTEYFSMHKLETKIASPRFKPTLIYSKQLMICFDPLNGMIIYIFEGKGIMQFTTISITVLSLILFTMCKVMNVNVLDFTTIKYDNGNPITLGLQIFKTISQCFGHNRHLSNTQCIVHPIKHPFYLSWGRYGYAMMTHVTEMTCRRIQEMLFYDERIINTLTQNEQPILNRFQVLAIAPVKPRDQKRHSWFDFHIAITLSEPSVSETLSFKETKDDRKFTNTDTMAFLSNLKELPRELQMKVLGEPKEFNDYCCNCLSAGDTLTKCLDGETNKHLPQSNRANFLFPISIRKRVNPLHSKSIDIYLVIRTEFNREPFYYHESQPDYLLITNKKRDKHGSVELINRKHFNRVTYNMNNKILGALASDEDPRTSNYDYNVGYEERRNPFFRTDSQFTRIELHCKHVK